MNQFLKHFREIPRGARLRDILTLEWVTAVQDCLKALSGGENITIEGDMTRGLAEGRVRLGVRPRFVPFRRGGAAAVCDGSFWEIITLPDTDPVQKAIRGGIIYCGDQTWNMDPQPLDLEVDGVWLVSMAITCESNRDDDGEILLPGILTGTRPTGDWEKTAWTTGTDYPDNDPPDVSDGLGTIHVPLGKLTIADGVATMERAGCGSITVGQCAGTLSHTRG